MEPLTEAIHHRCASGDDNSSTELAPQIYITALNACVHHFVNSWVLEPNKTWLEENLRCLWLQFTVNLNTRSARQDVIYCLPHLLHFPFTDSHSLLLFLQLLCDVVQLRVGWKLFEELGALWLNVAEGFLDLPYDLEITRLETLTVFLKQLHQVVSDVASSEVYPLSCIWDWEAFADCTGVRAPITDVKNHSGDQASRVKWQDRLCMEEDLRNVELFEEHLSKLDPVCNWVVGWLRDQNRVDLWTGLKAFEHMLIDMLHAFPVFDDAVLHRVRQLQQSPVFFLISKSQLVILQLNLLQPFRWIYLSHMLWSLPQELTLCTSGGQHYSRRCYNEIKWTYEFRKINLGCSSPANPALSTPDPYMPEMNRIDWL